MSADLERFKGILAAIAMREPNLSLKEVLLIADDIDNRIESELPELIHGVKPKRADDVEGWARWAKTRPEIMQYVPLKKINAIKELRASSGHLGLKEAKEAIEYLTSHLLP